MSVLLRKSGFYLASGLLLVCVFFGLAAVSPARADVGPQPILPGGSSLRPGADTPIQMTAETVVMNVRPATAADNAVVQLNPKSYAYDTRPVWFPGVAEVEAEFTLKNPTGEAVSMTVWFPLASALPGVAWNLRGSEVVPAIQSFQASVNGNPVDITISELPNPQGAEKKPLPWASFPVEFPAGKETTIEVSYALPLQPSVKGHEMALYYIFQTGAGWAGPIGQAELIVNLPYPASAETIAGNRATSTGVPGDAALNGNQARWSWQDFEPGAQDDFAIWLLQPARWQELENARAAVQRKPADGQAWLELAMLYHGLSITGPKTQLLFSPIYLPQGIAAYQEAAALLPDHPAPLIGFSLLSLAPYRELKDVPYEVLRAAEEDLRLAKELEARYPALVDVTGFNSLDLEEVILGYFAHETATAQAARQAIEQITQTAEATRTYVTATARAAAKATYLACLAAAGSECSPGGFQTSTLTPSPSPAARLNPSSTPLPTETQLAAEEGLMATDKAPNNEGFLTLGAATGALILAGLAYLVFKKASRR